MQLHLPEPPDQERVLVAVAREEDKRIQYGEITAPRGQAQHAAEKVLKQECSFAKAGIEPIRDIAVREPTAPL